MPNNRLVVGLACTLLLTAGTAIAQDHPTEPAAPSAVEFTPYIFLGSNSSSGVGGAVRWPLASKLSLELETNYRRAEIGAVTTNLSLLFDLPRVGVVTPYVAGGFGIDQYGTAESQAGRIVTRERTAFSINAGGGVRVQADQNWGNPNRRAMVQRHRHRTGAVATVQRHHPWPRPAVKRCYLALNSSSQFRTSETPPFG